MDRPRRRVSLSAGTIDYVDTGGTGATVVLLHGLLMDDSLWDAVIDELAPTARCVVPVLPLGAHRQAMDKNADLSLAAVGALVAELLDVLDLSDVTLVGNDTGGALVQLLVVSGQLDRVARLVLVSCDAFDNFPPGLTGKTLVLTGRLPPRLFGLFMQQLRFRLVRRLPIAFGWLTIRGDDVCRRWLDPVLHDQAVRRDTVRVLRSIRKQPDLLEQAASHLGEAQRPALVVWAARDRVMPIQHGRRLAELLGAPIIEVPDSATLVPLDQPQALAGAIRDFIDA